MTEPYDLRLGDCLEVLRTLPENSVDSVCTDPPYHLVSIVNRFGKAGQGDETKTSERTRAGSDGYARYARGFMGQTWDGGDIAFRVELWAEVFRVLKPGGFLLAFSSTRTYHRMAVAIEDAGFEIRDQIGWTYGSGFPKSHDQGGGRGTALKPAWEPICMARKPVIGTVAENLATWGTGAIYIDACRVPVGDADARDVGRQITRNVRGQDDGWGMNGGAPQAGVTVVRADGRWPANLIHDGSDDVLAAFPADSGAHSSVRGTEPSSAIDLVYSERGRVAFQAHGDSGSAARFFYCAKASKQDREEGLEEFERSLPADVMGPVAHDVTGGVNGRGGEFKTHPRANNHPTVKPTALMRYLCRLVTPPGGLVLDPFMGSGSTGKAAMLEGYQFLGIERDPSYMGLAKARVEFGRRAALLPPPAKARAKPKPKPKPAPAGQADLFAAV